MAFMTSLSAEVFYLFLLLNDNHPGKVEQEHPGMISRHANPRPHYHIMILVILTISIKGNVVVEFTTALHYR